MLYFNTSVSFRSLLSVMQVYALIVSVLVSSFLHAQEPLGGNSGTNNSSPTSQSWNLSTFDIQSSSNVVLSASIAPDFTPIVSAALAIPNQTGAFEVSLVSNDGFESIQISGFVLENGQMIVSARQTNLADALGTSAGSAAFAMTDSAPGFWSTYWYYLTNPTAMDDDLEYTFYGAVGTAAVAGTAAGGLAIAGVEVVIWGGGTTVVAGGGAAAGGGAVAGSVIGSQAVVATGLGAGTYPALVINGTVYVARFHNIAWSLAGQTGVETFYGFATINAAGKVIELIK